MRAKATVREIAEYSGVSRGTVDRVLNQRPHVRPDVRQRVIEAMRELNYIPPTETQAKALGLSVPKTENRKLGVILPTWKGHFYREVMRGISEARKFLLSLSTETLIQECETDMPDEVTERMDFLVQQGAEGLAVCAKDHRIIAEKINALRERGVPVVTYNSDISDCGRLCFIGEDLMRGGRVAGELMGKYLRPEDHLLIGIANPKFNAHRIRVQGFRDRLSESGFPPDCVQVVETYNDYDVTCQRVGEALRNDPKIRGVYMANHSVSGCAEAIREAGRRGTVHVISHDLTDATRRLLQRGEIDFVIAQNIYRQGYRPLIILNEYIRTRFMLDEESPSIDIICAENVLGRV